MAAKEIEAGQEVNFVVPTGNFGNILAAYYAKRMGSVSYTHLQSSWGDVTLLLADLAMGAVVGMLTAMIFTRILKSENRKEKRA